MDKKIQLFLSILLLMLSACTQQIDPPRIDSHSTPVDSIVTVEKIENENKIQSLGITKIKAGKKLKLARILEGGACKNDQQGAAGVFKLYTNPEDVKRIVDKEGAKVFTHFESFITTFSMQSLQKAINAVNFQAKDGNKKINEERIKQELVELFIDLVVDDIAEFERKTTLMIDVVPELESLNIFLNDCETPHDH
ncbi:MAG: hypothetical protein KAH20_07925 [Methylococcales bacterium]|nr:hypothetical protein [Methylococcales bacterium]